MISHGQADPGGGPSGEDESAGDMPVDGDRVILTCTVRNARAVTSKSLFALVDVDVEVAGVVIGIAGIQARHVPSGGISVHFPTYRGSDGIWHSAVRLPPEVHAPLTKAVVTFLVEVGFANPRFGSGKA